MSLSATSMMRDKVLSYTGEYLGKISDFMIDTDNGEVIYAVLNYGGYLGMGNKFFTVPLSELNLDKDNECFLVNLNGDFLDDAKGFSKNQWPETIDPVIADALSDPGDV